MKDLKDHEKRELVDALTKVAVEFAGTQQLRTRIAQVLLPALQVKEAASYEAFETWAYAIKLGPAGFTHGRFIWQCAQDAQAAEIAALRKDVAAARSVLEDRQQELMRENGTVDPDTGTWEGPEWVNETVEELNALLERMPVIAQVPPG